MTPLFPWVTKPILQPVSTPIQSLQSSAQPPARATWMMRSFPSLEILESRVGRVGGTAVAVFWHSVYVNGEVNGDVVAVLGKVELGPEARVRGDIVVVGGDLTRDPAATVGGSVQKILTSDWMDFDWLRP